MKKKFVSAFIIFTVSISSVSNAFGVSLKTDTKEIPLTVNGFKYDLKYPSVLYDGKAYISSIDFASITGLQINDKKSAIHFELEDGSPIAYFPLRTKFESTDGYVKWNQDYTIDVYTPSKVPLKTANTVVSSEVYYTSTPEKVLIDDLYTNLKVTSVTPHISNTKTKDGFYLIFDEFLGINKKNLEEKLDKTKFLDSDFVVPDDAPSVSAYEYYDTYKVLSDNDGFVSFLLDSYAYEGGAHGNSSKIVVNIDLNKKEVLYLSSLFIEDTDYNKIILTEIEKAMKLDPSKYEGVTVPTTLPSEDDFYFDFDNQNLVLYYEPYELAAGVFGFIYINIPLENIKEYIKPEYQYTYQSNF